MASKTAADVFDSFGDAGRIIQVLFVQPGEYNSTDAAEDLIAAKATQDLPRLCIIIAGLDGGGGSAGRRRLSQTDPIYEALLEALNSVIAASFFPQDTELLVQGIHGLLLILPPGLGIVDDVFTSFANVTVSAAEHGLDAPVAQALLNAVDDFSTELTNPAADTSFSELQSLVLVIGRGLLKGVEPEAAAIGVGSVSTALLVDRVMRGHGAVMAAGNFSLTIAPGGGGAGEVDNVDVVAVGWAPQHFPASYHPDLLSGIFSIHVFSIYGSNASQVGHSDQPTILQTILQIPLLPSVQIPNGSFAACQSLYTNETWRAAVGDDTDSTRTIACHVATGSSGGNVTVALILQNWTVCNSTEFEEEVPSWGNDRVCTAFTECMSNEYELMPPTNTTDRNCSLTTVCNATSQVELVRPTNTTDRICVCNGNHWNDHARGCLPYHNTCSEHSISVRNETRSSDRLCACREGYWGDGFLCAPHRVCTSHEHEVYAPNSTTDRHCLRSDNCTSLEYEVTAPTLSSNRECEYLRNCTSYEYEANYPTAPSLHVETRLVDRQCRNITRCTGNATERAAPNASADRICNCGAGLWFDPLHSSCQAWTVCDANATEATAPGFMVDRSCGCNGDYFGSGVSCSLLTVCLAMQFESVPATLTADRSCAAYTACGARQELVPATPTTDRSCACVPGEYLDSIDGSCQPMSMCSYQFGQGQFEMAAPTLTSNRLCQSVAVCASTEYESVAPTPFSNRECLPISICSEDAQEITAASNVTNRVCSCSSAYFGDGRTPPLPCAATAFVAKTLPSPCVSTAFVAKTLPLPCDPQVQPVSC